MAVFRATIRIECTVGAPTFQDALDTIETQFEDLNSPLADVGLALGSWKLLVLAWHEQDQSQPRISQEQEATP
jgi:hypothetical protein